MFNLAQTYADIDAAETARLRNQIYGNQLQEAQRSAAQQQEDRAREQREAEELRAARASAWGGSEQGTAALAALAPNEAAAIIEFRDSRIAAGRTAEIEEARAKAEQMGKAMAWIKASPDMEEAQARWTMTRENIEEAGALPEQFEPRMVDMMLARVMDTDKILEMGRADAATAARQEAFGGGQPDPRGAQGAIQPSANPQGLDPRIISAVDSNSSPLGSGLAGSESGGNFAARNDVQGAGGQGHFGRGQFSIARLDDAKRAGVMPAEMTPEQFLASPETQERVEAWHVDDIKSGIRDRGLDRFIGQEINGIPITEQGMVNVAHLGGQGGLAEFIGTAGQYDPADANGTKLSDYLAMGARDEAQAATDPMNNPRVGQLMAMAGDPNLTDAQKDMIGTLLDSFAGQAGPEPTSDMKNYDYARGQGYGGTFMDYQNSRSRAGQANVVVNTGDDPSGTGSYYKKLDEAAGAGVGTILQGAPQVMRSGQQIDLLDQALSNIQTGAGAAAKQLAGEWGINTDGLSEIQAAQALINQIVPMQRAPGSGTMSDADLALFKSSIPRIINQPGGNRQIIDTMRAINQYDTRMVEIATAVADRKLSPSEGREAMLQVPNPLAPSGPRTGQQQTPGEPPTQPQPDVPQILSADDYMAIPSGQQYIDPNGVLRTKR